MRKLYYNIHHKQKKYTLVESRQTVLLSYHEYEYLKEIEEIYERLEIKDLIETRFEKYNPKKNISWESIKEEI